MENQKNEKNLLLLYAEDDPDDVMLMKEAMAESRVEDELKVVEDGQELMDYLHGRGNYADAAQTPKPDIILLDLNLPRKDGREVLKEIKNDAHLKHIPVIVLTSSRSEEEITNVYKLGANSFIVKPVSIPSLAEIMTSMKRFWGQVSELPSMEDTQ